MSAENYITCPHCGKENLVQATRCIYCKEQLDIIPASAAELAAGDEDITAMLSAMAEEKQELDVPYSQEKAGNFMPEAPKPQAPSDEVNESDEIPSWLAHVRQRAQTEGDAQGLYNRESEPSAGQRPPNRESLDQPFNTWVGRIHEGQTKSEPLKGDASEAKADDMPVWLKRVRDLQLQPDENAIQKPTGVEAWKQEWSEEDLERLKNGEFDEKAIIQPSLLDQARGAEPGEPVEKAENQAAETEQQVEKAASDTAMAELSVAEGEIGDSPASDGNEAGELSAEETPVEPQEAQAAILKEVLSTESVPQYKKEPEKPKKSDIWRWIGILFLLAMLVAFYLLFLNRPAPAPLGNPAGVSFWNRLDSLQSGGTVLMILDYQPATADEMHANLQPVLGRLKTQNAQLSLVALWPDGLWLGRELLEETDFPTNTALNFLPGGSLAMLKSAAGLQTVGSTPENQASLIGSNLALKDTDLILYVSDNPDSTKTWIEQVGSFLLPEQSLVVSTQASQVMLQPYYDSSQIAGLSTSPYHTDGSLAAGKLPVAASPAFEAGMGVMAGFLLLSFFGKLLKSYKKTNAEDGKV